jgi:hypothetical protein
MTIWRMRNACWLANTTNAHSQHVILITFPLQQWLHESASVLRYTYIACLDIHFHVFSWPDTADFILQLRPVSCGNITYKLQLICGFLWTLEQSLNWFLFRNSSQEISWHTAYFKKKKRYSTKQFIVSTLCGLKREMN